MSTTNFERFIALLAEAEVEFVIIGGLAATVHGSAHVTFRFDPATVLAGLNFTLDTEIGPLDLLGEVAPLGEYPKVVEQSEEAELFGYRVRVLSLEALIRAKQAAGRNKDLLVIPELEALLEMKKRPPA